MKVLEMKMKKWLWMRRKLKDAMKEGLINFTLEVD